MLDDDSQGAGGAYSSMQYNEYYGEGSEGGQAADYSHMSAGSQGDFYQSGAGMSGDGSAGDSAGRCILLIKKKIGWHKARLT